ncbi:hypothetical protein ACIHCM_23630 [Streptomyces sp. NPDC052023]|uniref:hypothetical protein n=1 Tax=Streptomyces sp. NPDC052023 TaxID=3365681 RepID=UPI0037CD7BF9
MDSAQHVCPDCGQSVDTVVRRHKTLGAWVPVWVAGPCHNPKCGASAAEGAASGQERPEAPAATTPAPTEHSETETVPKKS